MNFRIVIRDLIGWGLFLFIFASGGWEWTPFTEGGRSLLVPLLYGTIGNAICLYLNAYVLIPVRKDSFKGWRYWLLSICCIIFISYLEALVDRWYCALVGIQTPELLFEDPVVLMIGLTWQNIYAHIAFWLFAFAYKFPAEQAKRKQEQEKFAREKELLQSERLAAELNYLKERINPHFLFNAINTVYHLIDDNGEQAKRTLLDFSTLLRYQLYECNVDFIPLRQEINYVQKYISIEKMRKGEEVLIDATFGGFSEDTKIAPLLLAPFVENAFKHLSTFSDGSKNWIKINLSVDQPGLFIFKIKNSTEPREALGDVGGFGLENAKKRLALIYPGRHLLDIKKGEDFFAVNLSIDLK